MGKKKLHLPATCGVLNLRSFCHRQETTEDQSCSRTTCPVAIFCLRHPAKKPNAKCKFCQRASKGCKAAPKKGKEEAGNEVSSPAIPTDGSCRRISADGGKTRGATALDGFGIKICPVTVYHGLETNLSKAVLDCLCFWPNTSTVFAYKCTSCSE